jgi:small subunit ribosomal protein S1
MAEIEDAIAKRDSIDRNKSEGSLVLGEGVVYLDTTDLTFMHVYDTLLDRLQ